METKIKIGWYEESITPNKSLSLQGQFYERISEYVETPITATAFAIENGQDSIIICSCDIVAINCGFQELVKEKLLGMTDAPLDKIMIHATHTHTSHMYKQPVSFRKGSAEILSQFVPSDMIYSPLVTVDETIMTPEESLEFLVEHVSYAIKKAWENRKPAIYSCGFGRAAVGMNRRACYDDGSAAMWGDTNTPNFTHLEGGNDNGVEMLFTFDAEKNITGVILNVACPAQVLEHRNIISSDYWGKVKIYLREKFGDDLFVLGLCAPAGDQCPRDLVRWQNGETPIHDPNISRPNYIERRSDGSMFDIQGTKRIGRRIANEVFAAYDEIDEYFTDPVIMHVTEKVELPLRRVTKAEYDTALSEINRFINKNRGKSFDYNDTAVMYVHAGTLERYEYQQNHDIYSAEMHFVRLGDIAFATNPFELFLDYGNMIRARSLAKQTFLMQYCCDCGGYLPTEKGEKGGHYSAFVSSGFVGHQGGDMLVRKTLKEINGFFEK